MRLYATWFDRGCQSNTYDFEDLELFDSKQILLWEFADREIASWKHHFRYVNRRPEYIEYPCPDYWIESGEKRMTCGRVWYDADIIDGKFYVPEYPDAIVTRGIRGGYRLEHV